MREDTYTGEVHQHHVAERNGTYTYVCEEPLPSTTGETWVLENRDLKRGPIHFDGHAVVAGQLRKIDYTASYDPLDSRWPREAIPRDSHTSPPGLEDRDLDERLADLDEWLADLLKALDARGPSAARIRRVLELPAYPNVSVAEIKMAFRRMTKRLHPDHGGTNAGMDELVKVRDAALRNRRATRGSTRP